MEFAVYFAQLVQYVYLAPLFLSTLFSLKSFKTGWALEYKLFSVFLIITLFNELFAISWKLFLYKTDYWDCSKSNVWIYNVYLGPQYLFYFLFFLYISKDYSNYIFKYTVAIMYGTFVLANLFFGQGLNKLNTFTIIGGSLLVLIGSSMYFLRELKRIELVNIIRYPSFWISTGSLIFHTASLPYFISVDYISRIYLPIAIALFSILSMLNVLMYSFYLKAFLCKKPSLLRQY